MRLRAELAPQVRRKRHYTISGIQCGVAARSPLGADRVPSSVILRSSVNVSRSPSTALREEAVSVAMAWNYPTPELSSCSTSSRLRLTEYAIHTVLRVRLRRHKKNSHVATRRHRTAHVYTSNGLGLTQHHVSTEIPCGTTEPAERCLAPMTTWTPLLAARLPCSFERSLKVLQQHAEHCWSSWYCG